MPPLPAQLYAVTMLLEKVRRTLVCRWREYWPAKEQRARNVTHDKLKFVGQISHWRNLGRRGVKAIRRSIGINTASQETFQRFYFGSHCDGQEKLT